MSDQNDWGKFFADLHDKTLAKAKKQKAARKANKATAAERRLTGEPEKATDAEVDSFLKKVK